MAWLHGAPGQVRRVAVGVAMAVAALVGALGAQPVHGATRDDPAAADAATTVTPPLGTSAANSTAASSAPVPPPDQRIELQVDYGGRDAPSGRDPAMTALVIAAGAHLVGIGVWAITRVAQVRRDERPLVTVGHRRHQRLG